MKLICCALLSLMFALAPARSLAQQGLPSDIRAEVLIERMRMALEGGQMDQVVSLIGEYRSLGVPLTPEVAYIDAQIAHDQGRTADASRALEEYFQVAGTGDPLRSRAVRLMAQLQEIQSAAETKAWAEAESDGEAGLRQYLEAFPRGAHAEQARERLANLEVASVLALTDRWAVSRWADSHRDHPAINTVWSYLERLDWAEAQAGGTAQDYATYLDRWSASDNVAAAKSQPGVEAALLAMESRKFSHHFPNSNRKGIVEFKNSWMKTCAPNGSLCVIEVGDVPKLFDAQSLQTIRASFCPQESELACNFAISPDGHHAIWTESLWDRASYFRYSSDIGTSLPWPIQWNRITLPSDLQFSRDGEIVVGVENSFEHGTVVPLFEFPSGKRIAEIRLGGYLNQTGVLVDMHSRDSGWLLCLDCRGPGVIPPGKTGYVVPVSRGGRLGAKKFFSLREPDNWPWARRFSVWGNKALMIQTTGAWALLELNTGNVIAEASGLGMTGLDPRSDRHAFDASLQDDGKWRIRRIDLADASTEDLVFDSQAESCGAISTPVVMQSALTISCLSDPKGYKFIDFGND